MSGASQHDDTPTIASLRSNDTDGDGLADDAELGLAAVRQPALIPLTTALARRRTQPVRLLFLGSSTTQGAGASAPALRYVDQLMERLQRSFPSGPDAGATTRDLRDSAEHPDEDPGLQGINGAVGGATSATYLTDAHAYGIRLLQPTCVVHMIGSNDAVTKVPAATYETQVDAAIARIDSLLDTPPCHVLVHTVRRYQVSVDYWAQYAAALDRVAQRRPRTTVIDVSGEFEARGAPGADPYDLIGSDAVHLTDAGHTLLAYLVRRALGVARRDLGTGTHPRQADTDRDRIDDGQEVHGFAVHQHVERCGKADVFRTWVVTVPFAADTDGDDLPDGREVVGYRLADGRLVRTDPSSADTDGDGRSDGREATAPRGDPTRCRRSPERRHDS